MKVNAANKIKMFLLIMALTNGIEYQYDFPPFLPKKKKKNDGK